MLISLAVCLLALSISVFVRKVELTEADSEPESEWVAEMLKLFGV